MKELTQSEQRQIGVEQGIVFKENDWSPDWSAKVYLSLLVSFQSLSSMEIH